MQRQLPTINHRHEMGLLRLAAFDIDGHADQRIDGDIMDSALQVELQVLPLIAEELALLAYHTNLFGQPSRSRPQDSMLLAGNGCIEHQNRRNIVDGFPGRNGLVTLASAAPALGGRLPFYTILKDLREGRSWWFHISASRLLVTC